MAPKKSKFRDWAKTQGRKPWAIAVAKTLVAAYMWALYKCGRVSVCVHPETAALLEAKTGLVIANWHGRLFMVAPFWRATQTMTLAAISSPHADGLVVGGAAERLGLEILRGTRGRLGGGAKALRGAVKALKGDACILINPDGPSGPGRVLGEGTIALAQLSRAPVVPFAFTCKRAKPRAELWDQALVPRFFDAIHFDLGAPHWVDPKSEREQARLEVEAAVNAHLDALDQHFA